MFPIGVIAAARRRSAAASALTGALMQVVDFSGATYTNGTNNAYSQLDFDDYGLVTDTKTFTTPSGLASGTLMRLFSAFYTGSGGCFARHFKNGAVFNGSGGGSDPTGGPIQGSIWSGIIPAVAGEAFTTEWENTVATAIQDGRNWFGVEIIPPGRRYTLAALPSALTVNASAQTTINWTHSVDTMGAHSNTANPNLFTVPSDTTGKVRITAAMRSSNHAANSFCGLTVFKNGVVYGCIDRTVAGSGAFLFNRVVSPIIDVVAGDTIEVKINVSAGSGWTYPVIGDNHVCFEELPASWRYCRVGLTANQALSAGDQKPNWDTALHDPEGCWSSATPNQIVVPSGATKARCSHAHDSVSGGVATWIVSPSSGITKQSGGGNNSCFAYSDSTARGCSFGSWFQVQPGWPLLLHVFNGGTLQATDRTWFQVEFQ